MIIGYECSLCDGRLADILRHLTTQQYEYYVPLLSAISNGGNVLPTVIKNVCVDSDELMQIAQKCIWELELHIYPYGAKKKLFKTYDEYINSDCICCLVFYDCKLLDVYAKSEILEDFFMLLCGIGANQLTEIREDGNHRDLMYI